MKKQHKALFRELNRHQFMLELDWKGTDTCIFRHIPHTEAFKQYITQQLCCEVSQGTGGCDLQVLCSKVCGVNLGVGYEHYHTPAEYLSVAEWEHIYQKLTAFLQQPLPAFPIPLSMQLARFFRQLRLYVLALLKRRK